MLKNFQFYKDSLDKLWDKAEEARSKRDAKTLLHVVAHIRKAEIALDRFQEALNQGKTIVEEDKVYDEWRREDEILRALVGGP